MDYKGYCIQETSEGFEVYSSYDNWINGGKPLHQAGSLEEAKTWIHQKKLLPLPLEEAHTTSSEITSEEWAFAEGMREVIKEDAEKGEAAGIYLWALLTKYYPDDKDKQIRLTGFMNEVQSKYGTSILREKAWELAKRWGVEEMLTRELMELFLGTSSGMSDYVITEGNPIRKYCCRQCGECAPEELLEEGKFFERISWLRRHYEEKHPGMWAKEWLA